MPRVFRVVLLCAMIVATGFSAAGAAPHIVVDMRSGKVLSQKEAFDRWYPASLTKLMTVYTVFREIRAGRISLLSPVKVTENALSAPPSKMGYPVGTVLNFDTAIKILMVKSANDIATAIAESAGGSESAFVARMNANALALGMRDSHFVNAHGLHDDNQYTSAHDLALLAMALSKEFPAYAGYFAIPAIRSGKRVLQNHNPLLQRFDGTTGMKTGFVCAAGLNIVVTAKRNGKSLLAVVLGGPTGQERNVRAAMLLTDAFRQNSFFIRTRLDSMKPVGPVKRTPTDMRDTVCKKRSKVKAEANDEDENDKDPVFGMKQPSLDELEAKYLKPKGSNTRIVPIVLGNATGPDPFGLVQPAQDATAPNVTSFAGADTASNANWPVVEGTKSMKVPLPATRPTVGAN
ncbi:MAG: D-alanyl-D-alanine carboxypeptidase [Nitratireductor sp.]|nr:D-alanyl-D-alanine carboxypeptidase [Nitratireductor sp.]